MTTEWRRLLSTERRAQRWRLLLAGLCAAMVAGASVLLLGLSGWFITGAALAGIAGPAAANAFNPLLPSACIRLLAILRTGCRYTERMAGHDAAFRVLARIRPGLYANLAAAPPEQALAMAAGDAVARVVDDVSEVEQHIVRASSRWAAAASFVAGLALLLLAGWAAAVAVLAVAAGAVAVAWLLSARQARLGHAVPAANGALRQDFAALANARQEVRAFGLESWAATHLSDRAKVLTGAQQRVTAFGGWFEAVIATATGLAAMLGLAMAQTASLPVAAMAALAAAMTVDGAGAYLRGLQRRGQLAAAQDRLGAMLTMPVVAPAPMIGDVPSIVLGPFGICLPPGTITGLVGPSGCGKTTLLEQLMRLRQTVRGRLAVGGVDVHDVDPAALRRCFAFAAQDAALLAGTVRDNLLLAHPAATEPELWDVLHDAALDERVRGLPQGLDTWLGDNGARLSGGERRRLVLARAYLRPAPWLLLDEPTEGLDERTEALVIARLQDRLARTGQGVILVSHRPAPLLICQSVFTLGAAGPLPRKSVHPGPLPQAGEG
jgi:ATP-binding cassette subfamily C protein CydC